MLRKIQELGGNRRACKLKGRNMRSQAAKKGDERLKGRSEEESHGQSRTGARSRGVIRFVESGNPKRSPKGSVGD